MSGKQSVSNQKIIRVHAGKAQADEADDLLVIEQPLEIRLVYQHNTEIVEKSLAVTMRTPAHDFELVLGFLFTEGIIRDFSQVKNMKYCTDSGRQMEAENIVKVELTQNLMLDWARLQRNFYTTSSCGVCGKTSIESVHQLTYYPLPLPAPDFELTMIDTLSAKVRNQQAVFAHTGGLHASALFDSAGNLLIVREDVGRHNALDKLIGAMLVKNEIPLHHHLLWVSGRVSFELVQKALMAGIVVVVSVGAPSSLAVEMVRSAGMTLIGFARNQGFNIYCGKERIRLPT